MEESTIVGGAVELARYGNLGIAALDFREGVDPTSLRQKLGVSEVTWQDTEKKLKRLTRDEGDEPGEQN